MSKIGRPKGGKNRTWKIEENLRIAKRCLDDKLVFSFLSKKEKNIGLIAQRG